MAKDHIRDYDLTAGNNTDVDGVNIAEGTAPSNINDAIREVMSHEAEQHGDIRGGLTSAGADGAYTLTSNESLAAYAQSGGLFVFEANHAMTDTATATLNIDAVGAKAIRKNVSVNLAQNDIKANQMVIASYEAATDVFHILSLPGNELATVAYVDAHGAVQLVNVTDGAVATGTTQIASDDTIPQKTEGDEYMTLAITPTNASNLLVIEAIAVVSHTGAPTFSMALFQDATAGALAATQITGTAVNARYLMSLRHYMVTGTAIETTFKIRIGGNAAGTLTFNGTGGARLLGGVMGSSITITEYKA